MSTFTCVSDGTFVEKFDDEYLTGKITTKTVGNTRVLYLKYNGKFYRVKSYQVGNKKRGQVVFFTANKNKFRGEHYVHSVIEAVPPPRTHYPQPIGGGYIVARTNWERTSNYDRRTIWVVWHDGTIEQIDQENRYDGPPQSYKGEGTVIKTDKNTFFAYLEKAFGHKQLIPFK